MEKAAKGQPISKLPFLVEPLKRPRDSNDDQVGGTRHLFEVDHSV